MAEVAATYRLHAIHCFEIAQRFDDPSRRQELLGVAQAWLTLAEHAEKLAEDAEKMREAFGPASPHSGRHDRNEK